MCSRGHNIVTTNFCRALFDDVGTLLDPVSNPDVPLCIRQPIIRFIHGAYFSDPKYKFLVDEEDPSIWSNFSYDKFKGIFSNAAKDLHELVRWFREQDEIEASENVKEENEDDDFDEQ
jgi:hypothetical protein